MAQARDKLILVVDDDESIRGLLEHVVKKEGFQAALAVDGEDALVKIERDPPDLIVMDLMLPRYGGFEILRRLQAGETARIPIVVVTGRYTDRSTADLIRQESNVVDFLEKPIKVPVFTGALHRVLKTSPPAGPDPAGAAQD